MPKDKAKNYEKVEKAIKLRQAGYEYSHIADLCGYNSPQAAWKAVTTALRNRMRDEAGEYVTLQLSELNSMKRVYYKQMLDGGSTKAGDLLLKILEREARLLGLDKPTKTSLTDIDGTGTMQITVTYKDESIYGTEPNSSETTFMPTTNN